MPSRACPSSACGRRVEVLTPDQRDVMLLRVIGRLTIDEIADVLGRRPGAVKMLQARAIASIRTKIIEGSVTL